MTKKVKRLFEQLTPSNYQLHIDIDEKSLKFKGEVTISAQVKGRPRQRLTLHQKDLKIISAVVKHKDKKGNQKDLHVDRINTHTAYDEVRIHTKDMIYPGEVTITLKFSGKITEQMHGIYPCNYKHEGIDKKLIATQFESHHAREAFPCIDEPEAKATFDLSVTADASSTILGNTEPKNTSTDHDRKTATFHTTPIMSTYLLAWVTGEMKHLTQKTKNNIDIAVYSTPAHINSTKFALDFAVKTLDFYERYFGIKYPLTKCDLVALPDFASGAMENWGLITFREECMLVNNKTSLHTKQYVAMVVAHELAHQWFGNLVTMRWWTDLWLNEGFASWVEFLAVDEMYPEWQIWDQFLSDEQQRALKLDALSTTHPVEVKVNHPDEIRTIFDTISYSKGASVIHMLHSYLGEEDFRKGLSHYLKKHSYGNTDTIDLWSALEEKSNKPVISFMQKWTSLSGFPLLCVDDEQITQKRFFVSPNHKDDHTIWPIPLGRDHEVMNKKSLTAKSPEIYNKDRSGFYRTVYKGEALSYVLKELSGLPEITRMGILSDMSESTRAGYTATTDTLKIIESLDDEASYVVWEAMIGFIASTKNAMKDKTIDELIKPFKIKLSHKIYKKLGWNSSDSDSHLDKLLRALIIGLNCSADEKTAIANCRKLYRDFIEKDKEIDPDIRSAVLTTVARNGDKKVFEELSAIHNRSNSSEERHVLSAALTNFKDPKLISNALTMIRSDNVRLQDVGHWLAYGLANIYSFRQTWEWLQNNWGWLEDNIGSDMSFSRMPMYVANHISDESLAEEYKKFFESKMTKTIERAYAQGEELIETKISWKNRDQKLVKQFLQ